MLVNGTEFAELARCSRQNVYKLVREKKLRRENTGKYDTEDRLNKNYLIGRGVTARDIQYFFKDKYNMRMNKKPKKKKAPVKKEEIKEIETKVLSKSEKEMPDDEFENITNLPAKMMNMTMKQLVMRYGGQMMLDKWATILNKLMQASERDQKIQEKRLDLIEKDFCVSKLFLYLETLSKLLFDYPESCIDNIIAEIKSNKKNVRNIIVDDMRKGIGLLIEQTKKNIDRELDNLTPKYKDIDDE